MCQIKKMVPNGKKNSVMKEIGYGERNASTLASYITCLCSGPRTIIKFHFLT